MKKTILFNLFIVFMLSASAQVCTIDSSNFASGQYVYPDSLPCIAQSHTYSGTVNIKVPDSVDAHNFVSSISPGTTFFHIDSIRVDSVTAYPTGLTTTTNPGYGVWIHGGGYACISFNGVTTDTVGNYPLNIYGRGCVHGKLYNIIPIDSCLSGNLGSVIHYSLSVCYPAGISEVSNTVDLNIYPNPNQGAFTITVSSASHINGTLAVVDELGRTIHSENLDVTGTKQIPLQLNDLASGSYLLVVNSNNGRSVKQFIVK